MQDTIILNINRVLEEYSIEVKSIKTESYKDKKGVWWIETPHGYYILKKHSNSKETIDFIIQAVGYLQSKGINIPEIITTTDNNNYVFNNNHCYILSNAIHGKVLNYNNPEELRKLIQELAAFHKLSSGFKPSGSCKPRSHLGIWEDDYKSKSDKLKGYFSLEETNSQHSAFGTVILEEFPHFADKIESAFQILDQSPYVEWVEETKEEGCLCHQDFAAGNLVSTDSGDIYVLDVDSITIDIPIRDIRKILNKVMKKHGKWDVDLVKSMLAWYQDKNPLSFSQWQVLKADLTFPHLFAGIMSKYYEQREKSWTQEKYLSRLNGMIKIEHSIEPVLESFDSLLPISNI